MSMITEAELRKIISNKLNYWINRISGKDITSKKTKEAKEMVDQVIDARNKKKPILFKS